MLKGKYVQVSEARKRKNRRLKQAKEEVKLFPIMLHQISIPKS